MSEFKDFLKEKKFFPETDEKIDHIDNKNSEKDENDAHSLDHEKIGTAAKPKTKDEKSEKLPYMENVHKKKTYEDMKKKVMDYEEKKKEGMMGSEEEENIYADMKKKVMDYEEEEKMDYEDDDE